MVFFVLISDKLVDYLEHIQEKTGYLAGAATTIMSEQTEMLKQIHRRAKKNYDKQQQKRNFRLKACTRR